MKRGASWISSEISVVPSLEGFKEMVKHWEKFEPGWEIRDVKGPYGSVGYLVFTFYKTIKKGQP